MVKLLLLVIIIMTIFCYVMFFRTSQTRWAWSGILGVFMIRKIIAVIVTPKKELNNKT
jgi:hypothetical protein